MTDRIIEQMSAFLDGELPGDEATLLVRRLERDPELRRVFGSFVLTGEVLASPGGVTASPGFAARVAAAVDAAPEPGTETVTGRPGHAAPRRTRPAFATAIAASVALAAVLLVRPDLREGQPATVDGADSDASSFAALPPGGASPTPAESQRLAGYLVTHSQFASAIGRRNVWSGVLAADPGIARVAYEVVEGP